LSSQPVRSYLVIAAAIVIAGVLISASLFVALGGATRTTTTTETTTLTSTVQQTPPTIVIGGATFTYTQWNSSTPSSFTISGVRFSLWTNTSITNTGGSCYGPAGGYGGYVITFSDGSSQTMTTCTAGLNPSTSIRLTSHVNPQAGLLIYPSTGAVYFLVSSTSAPKTDTISLTGFSIATTGVVQPTPFLSGQIYVNAAAGVTWSGYTLYTNNNDCGTRALNTSTTLNDFAYFFQGMPCGPITSGTTYLITFVVTFTDGTSATASTSALAS